MKVNEDLFCEHWAELLSIWMRGWYGRSRANIPIWTRTRTSEWLQTRDSRRGFDTEAALRAYLDDAPPGYEWHHIIEQGGQFRPDLTSPEGIRTWIQNTDNMVTVPVIKHYCISGWMSRMDTSGARARNIVKAHGPEAQRGIGIGVLHLCGVIR